MARSTGTSATSNATLSDWEHVQQSLRILISTPIGSRVMRREYGCAVHNLVDQKLTTRNILLVYSAVATAIERWEPRFRMKGGRVSGAGHVVKSELGRETYAAGGLLKLEIFGIYYPRGHLGDYSIAEDASLQVVIGATL